jgi:hypothetical protein
MLAISSKLSLPDGLDPDAGLPDNPAGQLIAGKTAPVRVMAPSGIRMKRSLYAPRPLSRQVCPGLGMRDAYKDVDHERWPCHMEVKVFTIMETYAKPHPKLSTMRGMRDVRPDFQVNIFYRENFVYLYDELFTSGKMSS